MDHPHSVDKIYPHELATVLDRFPDIKILSLDCFDTIFWRKTAKPSDVFFLLQNTPAFRALNFTAALRAHSEMKARQFKLINENHQEVTLHDIYRESFPALTENTLAQLTQEELSTESACGYAFPPMIELIRAAKERHLKVIIVSDTYFSENELRTLLRAILTEEIYAAIDAIFCSSDHHYSKSGGLFSKILKQFNHLPNTFLHIGDHLNADYIAPRALGMHALHLLPHSEEITDLMRLQAIAGTLMDQGIRTQKPLYDAFHGVLAAHPPNPTEESSLGYAALGPILYAFSDYLRQELNALKANKQCIKVGYLMRDAYLPWLSMTELQGEALGAPLRISRFTAIAATFRTQADIDHYLADAAASLRFHDLCKQLLLPEKVAKPLIEAALKSNTPALHFIHLMHRKDIQRIIFQKSADYAKKLKKHIEKSLSIKKGDTLVLIDLGYSGTVQRLLTPLLNNMGVEVLGRYLITIQSPGWEASRTALLNPAQCDDPMLKMLVVHIALVEQLCTSNENSVIDYDHDGNAIFSETVLSQTQHDHLKTIQSECLQFIHHTKAFFKAASFSKDILRQTAITGLARLLFLPTRTELRLLQSFKFDFNLGTKDTLPLFNPEQGLSGLRRRGLFYIEKNARTQRTNYPAELRMAGFELSLCFMAQHRFNLDIKLKDMLPREIRLPGITTKNNQSYKMEIEATATHDGYFSIWLPFQNQNDQFTILFGKNYQWVQIESVEKIPMEAFLNQEESNQSKDAWSWVRADQMFDKGGHLFKCASDMSAIVLNPLEPLTQPAIVRLVFRPIVLHEYVNS